jgi:hypothetical protein
MLTLTVVVLAGIIVIDLAWEALTIYLDYEARARDELDLDQVRRAVTRIDADRP